MRTAVLVSRTMHQVFGSLASLYKKACRAFFLAKPTVAPHTDAGENSGRSTTTSPRIEREQAQDFFLLEWTFQPADYFEERVEIARPDCTMVIDDGRVEARIPPDHYLADDSVRSRLHEELNARFLAAQVLCHKRYTLLQTSLTRIHPDGRIERWGLSDSGNVSFTEGTADFVRRDAMGNVIKDTRRERIERRKDLAQLAASHATTDATANAILRSYSAAVNDPGNELVHLYEIRDALATHFRGADIAKATLSISEKRWRRLGLLASRAPLTQGRHRGQSAGALRDATKEELAEARDIGRSMIESYLSYLHNRGTRSVP